MKMLGQAVARYLTEGELDVSTNLANSNRKDESKIHRQNLLCILLKLASCYFLYISIDWSNVEYNKRLT